MKFFDYPFGFQKHIFYWMFLGGVFLCSLFYSTYTHGQTAQATADSLRFARISGELNAFALRNPTAAEGVDILMVGTLPEFALAFAGETGLNLVVDPSLNQEVTANFANTTPTDILLHLARFYHLDVVVDETIISLIPHIPKEKPIVIKEIGVEWNAYKKTLQLDLKRDTLDAVVKEISRSTGESIVVTPRAAELVVGGFVGATTVEKALEQLALRNGLELVIEEEGGYYLLDFPLDGTMEGESPTAGRTSPTQTSRRGRAQPSSNTNAQTRSSSRRRPTRRSSSSNKINSGTLLISMYRDSLRGELFDANANGVSLDAFVKALSEEDGKAYHIFDQALQTVTVEVEGVPYEEMMQRALLSNQFTYKESGQIVVIGASGEVSSVRETRVVMLEHRTASELSASIPKALLEGVEVLEFLELNALLLDGSPRRIDEVEALINELDRSVPVITIELLIVDVQKNAEVRVGVEVGLAEEPVKAAGTVFPDLDLTLSSKGLNDILDLLAGNGIVNLGRVNPNFYARLQAAENNGYAKVHSKPRLSTINGREADFSLGETRYYQVQRTTLQGAQNPISLQAIDFESVNADFNVRILPVVSGDGAVTLEVSVDQSDFIGQIANDAPPAQVRRSFNSTIRVNEGDMVVLGGVTTEGLEDSGRGVPLLSRIPIIKWLFSSRRRANSNSELLIFVRPQVQY